MPALRYPIIVTNIINKLAVQPTNTTNTTVTVKPKNRFYQFRFSTCKMLGDQMNKFS